MSVLLHGPTSHDCPRTDSSHRPADLPITVQRCDVHVCVWFCDSTYGTRAERTSSCADGTERRAHNRAGALCRQRAATRQPHSMRARPDVRLCLGCSDVGTPVSRAVPVQRRAHHLWCKGRAPVDMCVRQAVRGGGAFSRTKAAALINATATAARVPLAAWPLPEDDGPVGGCQLVC